MGVYIIAEAGVNHNGKFNTACKLIDAAKDAGADCIKFQTFLSEKLVTKFAGKADYQTKAIGDSSQLNMLSKLELSYDDFRRLKDYCDKIGICFLSTPFDIESIHFLNSFDMPFWKIPSGEVTNYPYLVAIAKTRKPIIMSTGMCEMSDIENAINVLKSNGSHSIRLLHCNTEYPTPYNDVNLSAMITLKDHFGVEVGYSDHTSGIEVPIAAVAMGATVIEKHFTLSKDLEGPDHKASLEPSELKAMVTAIRNVEKAIGSPLKTISPSERKNIEAARKSIVAACSIKAGELFSEENLTVKRPGKGISPMNWNAVIGAKANRDYCEDEIIEL